MGIRELVIEQARQRGFKEGFEIGLQLGKSRAVKSLLTQTKLTIPEIVRIVDVTEAFVQNISNKLK